MKVLLVHNAYQSHHVGGEDIVVAKEYEALKKVLGQGNVFEYSVSNDDIKPITLAIQLWGNQIHFKKVATLVKQHGIDIVHVHNFFPLLTPSVFKGAKFAGAKVVHTLHNFRWWCSSGILFRDGEECEQCVGKTFGWPGVLHKCYRQSYAQTLIANMAFTWYRLKEDTKAIDAYFVLSRFQQNKLKAFIPANKMLLKPNGITPSSLYTEISHKKDYLFVGRLEQAKGIQLLLSTFAQLPDEYCLKIVGTGDNEQALRKTYANKRIQFLGKLPHQEVLKLMSEAKYFIHSSITYETFGLTLLEALSVGTPVIAIDRGPRSEFIQSGMNGFLCAQDELFNTIKMAHYYPDYQTLAENATLSVKPFYMDEVIDKQIGYYKQLLNKEVVHA